MIPIPILSNHQAVHKGFILIPLYQAGPKKTFEDADQHGIFNQGSWVEFDP